MRKNRDHKLILILQISMAVQRGNAASIVSSIPDAEGLEAICCFL